MRRTAKDTMYFNYRQMNPKNKNAGDCVVRAISSASNLTWDEVYDKLCSIGKKYKLMPNDDSCYERFLKENGWIRCKQPRKDDNTKYTGKEFCDYLNELAGRGIIDSTPVIISIGSHHLSMIEWNTVSGFTICDSWDCSDGCVGKFWRLT